VSPAAAGGGEDDVSGALAAFDNAFAAERAARGGGGATVAPSINASEEPHRPAEALTDAEWFAGPGKGRALRLRERREAAPPWLAEATLSVVRRPPGSAHIISPAVLACRPPIETDDVLEAVLAANASWLRNRPVWRG